MAQRRQRQVDLSGFLQTVACGARFGDSLRTGQIDHVKLSNTDVLLAICSKLRALNRDGKQRVGAGRVLVHLSLSDRSIFGTDGHDLADLVRRLGCEVTQVFHVDARVDLLVKFKSILRIL